MVSYPCIKSFFGVILFLSTNIFLASCNPIQPSEDTIVVVDPNNSLQSPPPLNVTEITCPSVKEFGARMQVECYPNATAMEEQKNSSCAETSHLVGAIAIHSCKSATETVSVPANLTWACKETGKWHIPDGILTCDPKSFKFPKEQFSIEEQRTCPPVPSFGTGTQMGVACFPNSSVTPGQQGKSCKENRHPIGSVAVHTCQPPLEAVSLLSNMTWTCKESGEWFIPDATLTCAPKTDPKENKISSHSESTTCSPIAAPEMEKNIKIECFPDHSDISGKSGINCSEKSHPVGTTAVHSCMPTYNAVSQLKNMTWTCEENGEWKTPNGILTCKNENEDKQLEKQCPPITEKEKGMKIQCFSSLSDASKSKHGFSCSVNHFGGTVAKFTCKRFYDATSDLSEVFWTCKDSGLWNVPEDSLECTHKSKHYSHVWNF